MRFILSLLVLLSTLPWTRKSMVIMAKPFLQISNQHPKCLEVESYPFFTLNIKYHTLDLVILPKDDSEQYQAVSENDIIQGSLSPENFISDLTLSVTLISKGQQINVMTENILRKKGNYMYNMEENGTIKICIQSLHASRKAPTIFGIDVAVTQTIKNKTENPTNKKETDSRDQSFNTLELLIDKLNELKTEMRVIQNTFRQAQIKIKEIRGRDYSLHQSYIFYPTVKVITFIISIFLQTIYLSNHWSKNSFMA